MDIALNFINNSNDAIYSEVVIFQKNVGADFDDLPVAWRVIRSHGRGHRHPFSYPMTMQVSASDSYGNLTPPLDAQDGQLFKMVLAASGDMLVAAGSGTNSRQVQVLNSLPKGSIRASIYNAGKLLATKTSIAPQQKAVFEFKPTLWIGVAPPIAEGEVMNSAHISSINTQLSLLGVASADIVMTGGGPGAKAKPLQFNLENVVTA